MKRAVCLLFVLALASPVAFAQTDDALSDDASVTAGTTFPWVPFDDALAAAKNSGKYVLVDIYAPWCSWCRRMQKEVYTDEELRAYLAKHYESGRLNIDDSETRHQFKGYDLTSQELGYGLGAEGTPTTVFLDSNGEYITRLPGYADLDTFNKVVRYIGSESFRDLTFQEYLDQISPSATN